jgi:hypothetical protein
MLPALASIEGDDLASYSVPDAVSPPFDELQPPVIAVAASRRVPFASPVKVASVIR